ncbi:MAG: asparagine synthase (glutamine-hydrolyzing) [Leptolyngbyaceae cyanobacterium bins.302]|nr:asparagine synthase (glutamine-hydrolyzing) [Leptolyngbyaceae cyanobacterium bins.302]
MCGFAGFVDFRQASAGRSQRVAWLHGMGQQLARRGPDDEQVWADEHLAFVFRRLAIVDVAGGQQPIWNEDATIFVAVNGEIYNHLELRSELREFHTFRTHSDAEIVLHLYEERGAAALQLLNGMFAIALWDTKRQQLFLARDRLGIKPLYYSQTESQLIFGSELKALLAHPNCPNAPNWHDLKSPIPRSSYVKQLYMLPAGHYVIYEPATNTVNPICYWSIEQYFATDSQITSANPEDYVVQYGELLVDSVRKRLMSDVPLGMFLSGGLDSSTIAAIAAQHNPDLHCFSVIEPCTVLTGDAPAARSLASHLHVPFHPVLFEPHQLLQQLDFSLPQLEYFIWMLDAPKFELEWFFKHELHRYAKTVAPDLKVMLLGQGADEFAGGYSTPTPIPVANWQTYLAKLHTQLPPFFAERPVPESWKPWLDAIAPRQLENTPTSIFQVEMLHRTMELQSHNLWHEDRTASSQGIESRVPFLDHRLVELLASIPPRYQAELLWDKAIIRRVARSWLPEEFCQRSKVGFFYSANTLSSVHHLLHQILLKIFPNFCDKYLETQSSPFSKTRMLELFHQSSLETEAGIAAMQKLINCIAMTIFNNLCQIRFRTAAMGCFKHPSPLDTDSKFRVEYDQA